MRAIRLAAYVVESHRFFVRQSYPYTGAAFIRHPFQWLRAYCRFMGYSIQDGFRQSNTDWGRDPFVIEAAKAAVNTLVRENERLRDARAKAENGECLLQLTIDMMEQDISTIRRIIAKGGSAADILKFLDTPNA